MTQTPDFVLKPNDRIVFFGDSITEQHLYTNCVETYLSTRFPELKLSFFNAGWGGDTAPGGAKRLQRDVLNLKPTVVTICYGMNDGRYCPPTDEIRTTFVGGMRELVSRLKAAPSGDSRMRSVSLRRLTLLRMVRKLVSVPPSQRSVT